MGRREEKTGAGRKTGGSVSRSWTAQPRTLWIAAGGVLLALLAIPTGLLLSRRVGDTPTLRDRVHAYQAQEQDEPAPARHAALPRKIAPLTELSTDPQFARLPPEEQDYVRGRLRELTAYRDYEARLSAVPDPKEARNEDDLKAIQARLEEQAVPAEYLVAWSSTEAYRRHAERLKDAEALAGAVRRTEEGYQAIVRDGEQVLANAAGANLPRRAQEVLDRAKALPDPERDGEQLIPGSGRITYATVFRFPRAAQLAGRAWPRVKRELEPLAELGKS